MAGRKRDTVREPEFVIQDNALQRIRDDEQLQVGDVRNAIRALDRRLTELEGRTDG